MYIFAAAGKCNSKVKAMFSSFVTKKVVFVILYIYIFRICIKFSNLLLSLPLWDVQGMLFHLGVFADRYVHGPHILSIGPMNILLASANSLLLRVLFVAAAHISIRFWLKFLMF